MIFRASAVRITRPTSAGHTNLTQNIWQKNRQSYRYYAHLGESYSIYLKRFVICSQTEEADSSLEGKICKSVIDANERLADLSLY